MDYIYVVLVGIATGILAGWLVKGSGFGWLINLIIGIVGAVIGHWMFCALGILEPSIFSTLITATTGAVLLLFFINLFGR